MPSLILSGDTLSVRMESRHLEVIRRADDRYDRPERMRVPLHDIDRVVIAGRPLVTIPVLQRIMLEGIPCFFTTAGGRWIGTLTPDKNLNAARRVEQYELSLDHAFRLRMARKLLYAKIRNGRRVLQRLSANRQQSHYSAQKAVDRDLQQLALKALNAESLEEARGYEGLSAAKYFARLSTFFPENVPFNGRNRRPPKDAANALLSWTYTIVLGEVDGCVRSHGLDACFGFLHEISHGTPALSLDLLEPLRGPVCDLLVLHILNHRILTEEDFERNMEDDGIYLKEEARKDFFLAYEQSMNRKFMPRKDEPHTDFRQVIEQQVNAVLRGMQGDKDVTFFLMP